jgi:hypothetical protein
VRSKHPLGLAAALALVIGLAASMVGPAMAANGDTFTCRASVLRLQVFAPPSESFEPFRANENNSPCRADEEGISGRRFAQNGLVTNGLVSARTEVRRPEPGKNAVSAHSEVADVALKSAGTETIRARGVTSRATVRCTDAGELNLIASSHPGKVNVGGLTLTLGSKPRTLDLGGIKLYLNRVIRTGNELTVRPVEVVGGDVNLIVAASRAGFTRASSCG